MGTIIEVAAGLLLVFLLMSILVSQINNIIKNRLNVRGQYYEQELSRLLHDPVIKERILKHPAIGMDEIQENDLIKRITAETLTDVLIDILAGNGETLERLENLENSPLVKELLHAIDNPELKRRLEQVLATARSLADARARVSQWFDTGLSRASELYKRRMVFFSVVVGAVLAVTLNVDTIYVTQALWTDPVLREATSQAAAATVQQADVTANTDQPPEDFQQAVEDAQTTVDNLLALQLPLGWYVQNLTDQPADSALRSDSRNLWNLWPGNNSDWFKLLLVKLVGIAITVLAVMQGAPFWFDLLRRATGQG